MSSKRSEIEKANEYLTRNSIKELFTRLTTEVTYYRPNDPVEFMISRLSTFKTERRSKPELSPMAFAPPSLKRVVFVIGPKGSETAAVARAMCGRVDRIHISVEALMARDAAQGVDLARARAERWNAGEDLPYRYLLDVLEKEMRALHARNMRDKERRRADRAKAVGSKRYPQSLDRRMARYETTFVVTGFPRTIKHVLDFEQNMDVREVVLVDATVEECVSRARQTRPGMDGASVLKFKREYNASAEALLPVVRYYESLGKLTRVPLPPLAGGK